MRKQYWILMSRAAVVLSVRIAGRATAGSLNPTNAPGTTMHTLEEIYQKLVETDPKVNTIIGKTMAWTAAITYCEGLDYGGQTDWRLPNAKELYSLIDLGRFNPSLPAEPLCKAPLLQPSSSIGSKSR